MANKIHPDAYYALNDIANNRLFPWCQSIQSVRAWVNRDRSGKNMLKAIIKGEDRARRYWIKGKNIMSFVNAIENGTYRP